MICSREWKKNSATPNSSKCVGLLGHYITIGTVIRMFDVKPPAGSKTF